MSMGVMVLAAVLIALSLVAAWLVWSRRCVLPLDIECELSAIALGALIVAVTLMEQRPPARLGISLVVIGGLAIVVSLVVRERRARSLPWSS